MYQRIVLAILFSIFMFCLNSMLAQDEWRKIYNGKDMDGWEQTGVGHFTVEPDGFLKTHDGLGCLIYTKEKFGNIRLRVSYKLEAPLMNGGVNFRIPNAHPKDAWEVANTGHEVQIWGAKSICTARVAFTPSAKHFAHPYSETDWNRDGNMDNRAAHRGMGDQPNVKVNDYRRRTRRLIPVAASVTPYDTRSTA